MEDVLAPSIFSNFRSGKTFKVDLAPQREQGRTFGPIFGLFLMNLLKAVTAKYDPLVPFQLVYNSDPWVAYENKQLASYQPSTSEWYPINNPYYFLYEHHQPLTTAKPFYASQHISSDSDYSSYSNKFINNYNYEDYNQVDQLIASASNNIKKLPSQIETAETSTILPSSSTSAFSDKVEELVPAESRYPPQKYKKRVPTRSPYIQKQKQKPKKKKTTTTPYPEYDDSYEEYEPPRRRPVQNQESSESYYSDDDDVEEDEGYDDYSYETTTKRVKNRRRKRPTRKVTKPVPPPPPPPLPPPTPEPVKVETTTSFSPPIFTGQTEIVIVRQASTTPSATTTTTTEPDTIITNTTTPPTIPTTSSTNTTSSSNNATYGYGPSNGNENISFTYGPSAGKYQYNVPYFDWYSHEATRNAIVKRVRDIVSFDNKFPFK